MKVSGFTIARNILQYNYPVVESITSILPICDEFIVNVGDSDDSTLELIQSIGSSKIKIIQNKWDMSQGKEVLSQQTNIALKECKGDWAFYLQLDEVIHEKDLGILKLLMHRGLKQEVDAIRLKWFHFYGSYFRYRVDAGWYQKQDRIIRNNGEVESFGDAYAFRRKDGQELNRLNSGCYVYHYGWVHSPNVMAQRRLNAEKIGFISRNEKERKEKYDFGDLNRFPPYFGSHPESMLKKVQQHLFSQEDCQDVQKRYWWHPCRLLGVRYKTFRRVKEKIE